METLIFMAAAAVFTVGAIIMALRQSMMQARYESLLAPEDQTAAFEGSVRFEDLTPERVREIRSAVDRVGVVAINEQDPNRQGKNAEWLKFEVYLLDANGVFHEVKKLTHEGPAARMALDVAERFGAPLDDPDGITLGR